MNNFTCLVLTPGGFEHPGLAIAGARAGGIGSLDVEYCRDAAQACINLETLIAAIGTEDRIGVRLCAYQVPQYAEFLTRLCGRVHWVWIAGWKDADELNRVFTALPESASRRVLAEVTSVEQATICACLPLAGLVARGHEAGGWIDADSSFILAQKLFAQASLPIYVQGGIGVHTASACRMAGAAGVVLDDQLLLMPESPLPQTWRAHLEQLTGQEATVIGEQSPHACRVLARPGFKAVAALQQLAARVEMEDMPASQWRESANQHLGWGEPGSYAWPLGQAVGLAAVLRDRYRTTGRLVQSLLKETQEHILTSKAERPLAENSALAKAHGTRFPIVQGPMTRVSDKAAFAAAVAAAGALPMLALALMRGEQAQVLLEETRDLLQDRPWGVGILGFVPQQLREEQIDAINRVKPPFALIAGGRPDQAAKFEAAGIPAYIHAPSPRLLKMFIEQGARRFVFEGRECGGHVGPLSSFVLWEQMINVLLHAVPNGAESDMHVLFAGGIHDARSAAMVSAMIAPLSARGMRAGVLMGSAYLFTQEIVASGAIVADFQQQALACTATINLETGPGHASRCAVTPFAYEFYKLRRQMMREGKSAEEIKNILEDLNLGRLRIASKGLMRDENGRVTDVPAQVQLDEGMYMIGQIATLCDRIVSVAELHAAVSVDSSALFDAVSAEPSAKPAPQPSNIAVIGIGILLPKANSPQDYWRNILTKTSSITEIPAHRWDWRLYYDADRQARDKVYSKWGGFIDDVVFDPMRFGIPPNSLKSIDPMQLLALEVVRRGLEDAGYADGNFDRENTSVVLGAGGGLGDMGLQYGVRSDILRFVEAPSEQIWDRLPEWTEESFAGSLLNVVAGRIANRFDFGGCNFTVDAACASSLAALHVAVNELESGRSNMAIAGGVDTVQSPFAYLCFSKTQALSPKGGARSFDKNADGIVISEGLAVVVLKRLADAERDGDRVYAVIKSIAGSSDGKALGLTAPLPAGQRRALTRAYQKAGFGPETLGLVEAHGTGTAVGDSAEAETVTSTLRAHHAAAKSCALGSVKTLLGHTKATAGVAAFIKATLSLHHKVLPPHAGVENPLPSIAAADSPVYLLKDARPWLSHPDHPRRAGTSAFGFGGTNFHAVLEEYRAEYRAAASPAGAYAWPCELLIWRGATRAALAGELQTLAQALSAGAKPRLRDLAYSLALRSEGRGPVTLAMVIDGLEPLQEALQTTLHVLKGGNGAPLPANIFLADNAAPGKLAFLFPGQGSQYPHMAEEALLYVPELRAAVEFADRHLRAFFPRLLSQAIYPPSAYTEEDEQQQRIALTDTHIAQPALGALAAGYLDLMRRLGIQADMACGHSYGEYAALHCAGVFTRADFLSLSEARGRIMAQAGGDDDAGTMAAVQVERERLLASLHDHPDVVIANHNAPLQSVISGPRSAVEQLCKAWEGQDVTARMLHVAAAFHSPLVASAQADLAQVIAATETTAPRFPVYSNIDANPYPATPSELKQQLARHLLSSVEFVADINAMYEAGARTFIELGPKSVLTQLTHQILQGRAHTAVSLDGQGNGLRGLLLALAQMAVNGIPSRLIALFDGRDTQALDLARLAETTRAAELPKTAWLINGGNARRASESIGHTGKLPALSKDTLAAAKRDYVAALGITSGTPLSRSINPAPKVAAQSATPETIPHNGAHAVAARAPQQVSPVATAQARNTGNGHYSQEALIAYQDTMRQFMALQEQVMRQFLSNPSSTASVPLASFPQPSAKAASGLAAVAHAPVKAVAPARIPSFTSGINPPSVSAAPVLSPAAVMAIPVPAPAVAASATLDKSALTALVLDIVSERTGYPSDMLGLNHDMEAELGIDSIKRVEILGALQKRLSPALADHVQKHMEQFTRAKSLGLIVEQLLALAPAAATVVSAPVLVPAAAGTLDKSALTEVVLDIVSERTG